MVDGGELKSETGMWARRPRSLSDLLPLWLCVSFCWFLFAGIRGDSRASSGTAAECRGYKRRALTEARRHGGESGGELKPESGNLNVGGTPTLLEEGEIPHLPCEADFSEIVS